MLNTALEACKVNLIQWALEMQEVVHVVNWCLNTEVTWIATKKYLDLGIIFTIFKNINLFASLVHQDGLLYFTAMLR